MYLITLSNDSFPKQRKEFSFIMQELLSIIIPIYNTEKYLRQCLDSVLQQTYVNLEIILVDDGSPDNCPQICDEYAVKDNRIKVIHKTNGGLSSARNAGLDVAMGEWIGFVDSDDWLLPDMYERLYSAVKLENADLAICGYKYVDESNAPITDNFSYIKNEILAKLDVFNKLIEIKNSFYVTAFNKIYAKKIFLNLRFPVGRIHEDEFIVHHIFAKCEKTVTISDILYMYVQREGSIMHKPFSIKRFDRVDAYVDRYNFFKLQGLYIHAKLSLQRAYAVTAAGLSQLDHKTNKQTIKCYYSKVLWLLVMERDLHAIKLFVFRHKTILSFLRHVKKCFGYNRFIRQYYLAKKPKIFFMATPIHGNLGDHAIVYAERQHFKKQGKKRSIVEVRNDDWFRYTDWITKKIKPNDLIVIDGGGNLGTLWPNEDNKITDIISRFKDNEIIIFPQTCWYDDSKDGHERLKRNKKVYATAKNLTIMLRDKASYDFASINFSEANCVFTKDIVLTIDDAPKGQLDKRDGVLLCFREDKEKVLPDRAIANITQYLQINNIPYAKTSTVINKKIMPKARKQELLKKWDEFAASGLVITDRLHGMIFAMITNTPCIALNNESRKIEGSYEFVKDFPNIRFLKNADEVVNNVFALYRLRK